MSESSGANYNKVLQWPILSNRNIFLTIVVGKIQVFQKEESRGTIFLFVWSPTLKIIITSYSP